MPGRRAGMRGREICGIVVHGVRFTKNQKKLKKGTIKKKVRKINID